jgi:hypothetical protein
MTSTPSATLRQVIKSPTATAGTSCSCTPTPEGALQTDSTRHIVSSPTSDMASTSASLSGLENKPTPIPKREARAIITHPVRTRATEKKHIQRHWHLLLQAVSTPRSMIAGSPSIPRFVQSDMPHLVIAMGRLHELYMWNRRPFISESDLVVVSYEMRCFAKSLSEAPDWHIIETYWNTAMQQHNVWSIALEAPTKEILTEVC